MIFDQDMTPPKSFIIATTILGLWFITLTFLLSFEVRVTEFLVILIGIALQTFLNTGLFITGHEAMHGLVCPKNPKLNRSFGILVISLYALFSYDELLRKHWLHHHHPASLDDPDFHNGDDPSFLAWYVHFLKGYWNWRQFSYFFGLVILLSYIFHIAVINLCLFWLLPLILSSLQLFYFGTFLPHRQPLTGYDNFHRANSINLPIFLSFLSCYHFGYHQEHHEHPDIPWWQLPQLHFK
jgi:beta-carotene/zeaxanthin 4-ketolase